MANIYECIEGFMLVDPDGDWSDDVNKGMRFERNRHTFTEITDCSYKIVFRMYKDVKDYLIKVKWEVNGG